MPTDRHRFSPARDERFVDQGLPSLEFCRSDNSHTLYYKRDAARKPSRAVDLGGVEPPSVTASSKNHPQAWPVCTVQLSFLPALFSVGSRPSTFGRGFTSCPIVATPSPLSDDAASRSHSGRGALERRRNYAAARISWGTLLSFAIVFATVYQGGP